MAVNDLPISETGHLVPGDPANITVTLPVPLPAGLVPMLTLGELPDVPGTVDAARIVLSWRLAVAQVTAAIGDATGRVAVVFRIVTGAADDLVPLVAGHLKIRSKWEGEEHHQALTAEVTAAAMAQVAANAAQAAQAAAETAAETASGASDAGVAALVNNPASVVRASLSSTYATGGEVRSKVKTDGTDQTATLQAELDALVAGGGGKLLLPEGTVTIAGTLTLVNDGATPPKQPALQLIGQGAHWSGRGTPPVGGTTLDIKGADTYGKIKTNGLGLLRIEGVTLRDSSGGTTPFVYTTNTTLHVSRVAFYGSKVGPACDQDGIILGGPNQVEGGAGWDDGFQGYGTIIADCFYSGIRRGVVGQAFANAVKVARLTAWTTCGNSAGGFIEWNGRPTTGAQVAAGGTISDCLIEMPNYQYGIVLRYTIGMDIRGNSFYDFGASSLAGVLLDTTATGNRVVNGANVAPTKQAVIDLGGGNNVLSMEAGVPVRWGDQAHSFLRSTVHANYAMSMDLYSGNLAYVKALGQSGGYGQIRLVSRTGTEFTNGVTTDGSTTITSATAGFAVADLGMSISGTGIPNGTLIVQVLSATSVVVSKACTATATGVTFRVARPVGGVETEQVSFGRQHWKALGTAPTAAVGAGAGSGATASLSGVDVAGRLSITTGTGPTAGVLGSFTPAIGFASVGRVQLTARNQATATLLAAGYWVSGTSGAQSVNVLGTPVAATLYEFDYFVVEA